MVTGTERRNDLRHWFAVPVLEQPVFAPCNNKPDRMEQKSGTVQQDGSCYASSLLLGLEGACLPSAAGPYRTGPSAPHWCDALGTAARMKSGDFFERCDSMGWIRHRHRHGWPQTSARLNLDPSPYTP